MVQNKDRDEWELYDALAPLAEVEFLDIKKTSEVELPKRVKDWEKEVLTYSLFNEFPAVLSYFCLLGQILKDFVRIPIGPFSLDPRVQVCWIQTSRTGKSAMFKFLEPVWSNTFELINNHPTTFNPPKPPLVGLKQFTLHAPDSFTDQALLGTMRMNVPNPNYNRRDPDEDEPEFIDTPIPGLLEGSGLICFDEFEHSGLFKETQHKQETVMHFQKFMNSLDSPTHIIRKRLTEWGRDLVVDCQRSLWATTLPPEGLERVILTKGVFQRMLLYVREVPESLRMKMEEEYLNIFGEETEVTYPIEKWSEEFYSTYKWVEQRYIEADGDPRKVITFSEAGKAKIKSEWRAMRKYMNNLRDDIYEATNTFIMNTINNIGIMAVLCAVSERQTEVTDRHVRQAAKITSSSFTSIIDWFEVKLRKAPKRIMDRVNDESIVKAYGMCSGNVDGWVLKAAMCSNWCKVSEGSRSSFYRKWPTMEYLFEEKTMNNKKYIRRIKNE